MLLFVYVLFEATEEAGGEVKALARDIAGSVSEFERIITFSTQHIVLLATIFLSLHGSVV